MTRRALRAIFTAAFAQAVRLTAEVEPHNRRALRQVQRMGFIYEGYRRWGSKAPATCSCYGMLRDDCKYLPGYKGPTVTAARAAAGTGARKASVMDQQQPGPSLEELLAILAAQNPDADKAPPPSAGRDALAAILARVNKPGQTMTGPMTNIGIRG